jgi:acyl-CoA synthetase (AMP-forming)/AMP-acid ligase II
MVVSGADEPLGAFMARAGAAGVTHMSGTPSHWRRALMSGSAGKFSPGYIRLSGEVADQAILNQLHEYFPAARIAHAFASTEAGVAFDVRDGLAGFPESLMSRNDGDVQMKVVDGTLRVRSSRLAAGYRGDARLAIDAEGFVDTSDMVELRDGRYYFIGRREGLINVGGLKVHPEEIEAVVNLHPAVQMSCAHGRRSPITGAIVVASIVIRPEFRERYASFDDVKREILTACRQAFPPHKVPSMLYEVPSLEISASGKLLRPHA